MGHANELTKTSSDDAIFFVCKASRDVAIKEYLRYTLTTMTRADPPYSQQDTCWPPVPFYFRPTLDTLYAPRVYEFIKLFSHTNMVKEGYDSPLKGLECILSLALGGIVEELGIFTRLPL